MEGATCLRIRLVGLFLRRALLQELHFEGHVHRRHVRRQPGRRKDKLKKEDSLGGSEEVERLPQALHLSNLTAILRQNGRSLSKYNKTKC